MEKIKCPHCGKSFYDAQDPARCTRCGKEVPQAVAHDFWARPGEEKKSNEESAEVAQAKALRKKNKKSIAPRPRVVVPPPKIPPQLTPAFDWEQFFHKFSQMAIVAGIVAFVMFVIFMSISSFDRQEASITGDNRPPIFKDQRFAIGPAVAGKKIGILRAADPDGDQVFFRILNNPDEDSDRRGGVALEGDALFVDDVDEFQAIKPQPVKLLAQASDGRLTDRAQIVVDWGEATNDPIGNAVGHAIQDLADEGSVQRAVGLLQCSAELTRTGGEKVYSPHLFKVIDEAEIADYLFEAEGESPTQRQLIEFRKKCRKDRQGNYIVPAGGFGTCFIISPDGYAVTNKHVINDHLIAQKQNYLSDYVKRSKDFSAIEPQLIVFLNDSTPFKARVVTTSLREGLDFALIKIEGLRKTPHFRLFDGVNIPRNTSVKALGFPGVGRELSQLNQSDFPISPKEQWWSDQARIYDSQSGELIKPPYKPFSKAIYQRLSHSAAVFPGNSGGPLVTDDGIVVGINTWTHDKESVSYAILIDSVLPMIDQHADIDVQRVDQIQAP